MRASELLRQTAFECACGVDVDATGLAYDSRAVEGGDLFFCVPGTVVDGHDFAKPAVAKGASGIVVERELADVDCPQYVVADARKALALAACEFYGNPSREMRVVGVTGTNGKTTTTYLTEWMARQAGCKTGVIGTVETRIGDEALPSEHTTPESLDMQRLFGTMRDGGVDICAIEVSSHAIDLGRALGTHFSVCAFTNLTQDHLDYHRTMEEYFAVKSRLFLEYDCDARVVCIDDEYGERLANAIHERGMGALTVGLPASANVTAKDIEYSATGTSLTIAWDLREGCGVEAPEGAAQAGEIAVKLHLIGRFNVENALVAFGIGLALGMTPDHMAAALATVPQVPGRLERVHEAEKGGVACLVDYAHTPDAIEKALSCVMAVTKGDTIIVFGCGGDRDATKRPKMGRAATAATYAFVTSDNPRTEDPEAIIADILPGMEGAEGRYEVVVDRKEAIRKALERAKPGDSVLIAGKGHEDYQILGTQKHHFDDREVASEAARAIFCGAGE